MYISEMEKKFHKRFLLFLDNCIWIRSPKFQILQREYLSPAVNVLTKSGKITNITNKRGFLSQSPSEIQHNLMKVLSWRFHKCLGPSNMLRLEWWYEAGLFRHLRNHVFQNLWLPKYTKYERQLCFKLFKISCRVHKFNKVLENVFRIFDNFIWNGCGKFSLLRRDYLSTPIKALRKSPKG